MKMVRIFTKTATKLGSWVETVSYTHLDVYKRQVYTSAPAMCAVGCRKALELAAKWVYSADNTMQMPYKDNLQSLIHEPTFRFAVDYNTWGKLPFIIKLGNLAVHTAVSYTHLCMLFLV